MITARDIELFESSYIPEPMSGCWLWTETVRHKDRPYGVMYADGKTQGAHRISYQLFKGEIPSGLFVLHKCDNPACVNPDHLFVGTQQDNMDDMLKKGRRNLVASTLKGTQRKRSVKVTEDIVWDIRFGTIYDALSSAELSKIIGISPSEIRMIRRNQIWRHVTKDYIRSNVIPTTRRDDITVLKLTGAQIHILSKVKDDDAYWTSDIAHDVGRTTNQVRSALRCLLAKGCVEVVVERGSGFPTSWRRTEAGRSFLQSQRKG